MDDKEQIEKLNYWKVRAINALKTAFGWSEKELVRVSSYVTHANLEDKAIRTALKKIQTGYAELSKAIAAAEVKKSA